MQMGPFYWLSMVVLFLFVCALLAFYVSARDRSFDHRPAVRALTGTLIGILGCNAIFVMILQTRMANVDDANFRCMIVTRNFLLWTSSALLCMATLMLPSLWRCARGQATRSARYFAYISFVLMALTVLSLLLLSVYSSNVKRCRVLLWGNGTSQMNTLRVLIEASGGLGRHVDIIDLPKDGNMPDAVPSVVVYIVEVADTRQVSVPRVGSFPKKMTHLLILVYAREKLTYCQTSNVQKYLNYFKDEGVDARMIVVPSNSVNRTPAVLAPFAMPYAWHAISEFLKVACPRTA